MRRLLISISAILMLAAVLAQPAAASDSERPEPTDTVQPTTVDGADAKPVDTARPTDARPKRDEPRPELEMLKLECSGRTNDAGEPAVGCEWSQAQGDRAAGYVLYRTEGDHRLAVFRTDDIETTRFVDREVRVGVRYKYRVVAVDVEGNKVGASRGAAAGVAAPEPEVEVLEIVCEPIQPDDSEGKGVACKWSPTTVKPAVGYQLWRIVNRGEREAVWRGGLDTLSHSDRVPASTKIARYAILAVDESGEIVARSRATTVRFEHDRPEPSDRGTDKAPADSTDLLAAPSTDDVAAIAEVPPPTPDSGSTGSTWVVVPTTTPEVERTAGVDMAQRVLNRLIQMLQIF